MEDLASVQTQFGQTIFVPPQLTQIYSNFEPLSVSYLSEYVSIGQVVVDVGLNFGYYSVIASHLVGPSGRVLAFEPSPETGKILSANIKRLENIEHISMAVSDISGSINSFTLRILLTQGQFKTLPFRIERTFAA